MNTGTPERPNAWTPECPNTRTPESTKSSESTWNHLKAWNAKPETQNPKVKLLKITNTATQN